MQRSFYIWLLISLFYAYQYVLRVMPNIVTFQLMQIFDISLTEFGQFSISYYAGYAIAHIPIGILLDRFGLKNILPICIILVCIGTLPLAYSSIWYYPILGRTLVGIGSSAAAIGVFKAANMYFSQEKSAKMASLSIAIGILGAICGSGRPLEYLFDRFGWDYIIYTFVAFGCLLAPLSFFVIPKDSVKQKTVSWKDLKVVFFNKHIFLISLFSGFMVGPLQGFADAWTVSFLCGVYKFDRIFASSLSPLIFMGMGIGSFFLAYLLGKCKDRHFDIVIACAFIMIASFLLLFTGMGGIYVVLPTLFIIGVASGYQVITIYKAISYVNANLVGIATAISNMILMGFSPFFHTIISKIAAMYWDGTILYNNHVYSPELLIKAISIIPACLLIAAFGFMWLKMMEKSKDGIS